MSSAAERLCPKCGATARADWKFCGKCRAPLPPMQEPAGHLTQAQTAVLPVGMTTLQSCSTCHQPVEEGGGFCENCGAQIVSHAAPRASTSPPPNTSSPTIQPIKESPAFAGTENGVKVTAAATTVLPEKPETADEARVKPASESSMGRSDAMPYALVPRASA